MHGSAHHHPILMARLALAAALVATAMAACGGYGSNYGSSGGMGSCGVQYGVACPPPSVTLTAPAAGATVSGTVAITATATAATQYNLTIASVEFLVDGTSVGMATTSAYTVNWDTTKVANGSHALTAKATDSMGDTGTTPAINVTVQNGAAAMSAVMAPGEIFPAPASKASGVARVVVQRDTGAVSGSVTLQGVRASTLTLNEGFAGSSGEAVLALAPKAGSPGEWDIPAGLTLTSEQLAAAMQGRLYLIATSTAHPEGEVRGQLAPDNIRVTFSELTASPASAALGLSGSGLAATTVDTGARTLTLHVNTAGVAGASSAAVDTGAARIALARDAVNPAHWSVERAAIGADAVARFEAGRWSADVGAPQTGGSIRGSINSQPAAGSAGAQSD
jgi:hypothetical protein